MIKQAPGVPGDDGSCPIPAGGNRLASLAALALAACLVSLSLLPVTARAQATPQVNFLFETEEVGESVAGGQATLTIVTVSSLTGPIDVNYRFLAAQSSATLDADFTIAGLSGNTGSVRLTPTAPRATINVSVVDDSQVEGVEELLFELLGSETTPPQYNPGLLFASRLRIYDDDGGATRPQPRISFVTPDSGVAEEGETVEVEVRVTPPPAAALTINYNTMPEGTATSGADYPALSGRLTVPADAGRAFLPIMLTDDTDNEPRESLILMLQEGSGYSVGSQSRHQISIAASDTPEISFAQATLEVAEHPGEDIRVRTGGDDFTEFTTIMITLNIAPPLSRSISVGYRVSGTAIVGSDYLGLPDPSTEASLRIGAGESTHTIPLYILADRLREGTETLVLELLPPTDDYILGANTRHTLSITDDPLDAGLPIVRFGSPAGTTVTEGGAVDIPLIVDALGSSPLSVSLAVDADQSTAENSDYTLPGATLVSTASGTSVRLQTNNDGDNEDEVLVLQIAASSGNYDTAREMYADTRYVVRIRDSGAPTGGPTVQFRAAESIVREPSTPDGEPATITHQVTLRRSGSTAGTLDVMLQMVGLGDATPDTDYTAPTTARFAAGQQDTNVALTINSENLRTEAGLRMGSQEGEQVVQLLLLPGSGYQLGARDGHRVTISERFRITATLRCLLARNGEVCADESGITEGDVLLLIGDLSAGPNGRTDAGRLSATIPNIFSANTAVDLHFCVSVDESDVVGTDRSDPNLDFIVLNAVEDGSCFEFDSSSPDNETQAFRFTVQPGQAPWVQVEIADDDRPEGIGGVNGNRLTVEFRPIPGTGVIAGGGRGFNYNCNLTSAFCTITDNDVAPPPMPTVQFLDRVSAVDENAGTVMIPLRVQNPPPEGLVIDYRLSGNAVPDADYVIDGVPAATGRGSLLVPPSGMAAIPLWILDDLVPGEPDRTLALALQARVGDYQLGANSVHTLTLRDDDVAGALTEVSFETGRLEVNEAGGSAVFIVNAVPPTIGAGAGTIANPFTVDYRLVVADTTAPASVYTIEGGNSGTLSFSDAGRRAEIRVILTDNSDEDTQPSRILAIELVQPEVVSDHLVVAPFTAQLVINDDDGANMPTPRISFAILETSAAEGERAEVEILAVPTPAEALTVNYTPAGTATAGEDYTALSGTLTLAAGTNRTVLSVELTTDSVNEPRESLLLTLQDGDGYTLGSQRRHRLNIDDVNTPRIGFSSATSSAQEPSGNEQRQLTGAEPIPRVPLTIGLDINPTSSQPLWVGYRLTGTARVVEDYLGLPAIGATGSFRIEAGANSHQIPLVLVADRLRELTETLTLELLAPIAEDGYTLGTTTSHTLSITPDPEDGTRPLVRFGAPTSVTVTEGATVDIPLIVEAFGSSPLSVSLVVDEDQSTADAADYTLPAAAMVTAATGTRLNLQTNGDGDSDDEILVLQVADSSAGEYDTDLPMAASANNRFVVRIQDSAAGSGPTVQFVSAASLVNEPFPPRLASGSGTPTRLNHNVTLMRGGNTSGELSVQLAGVGRGGAIVGSTDDFRVNSPTVTFAAGQARASAQVTIFSDGNTDNQGIEEGQQVVELLLLPGTGYQLGTRSSHRVTILENAIRFTTNGSCTLARSSGEDGSLRTCAQATEGDVLLFESDGQIGGNPRVGFNIASFSEPLDLHFCINDGESSSVGDYTERGNPEFDFIVLNGIREDEGDEVCDGEGPPFRITVAAGQVVARAMLEIVDDDRPEGPNGNRLSAAFLPIPNSGFIEGGGGFFPIGCNQGGTLCVITDNDVAPPPTPMVQFQSGTGAASESGGTVSLPLIVNPLPPEGLLIDYQVVDIGTNAQLNTDYTIDGLDPTTLRGQALVTPSDLSLVVGLVDDGLLAPAVTLRLALRDRPGFYDLGARTDYTLTINDDDTAFPPEAVGSLPAQRLNTGGRAVRVDASAGFFDPNLDDVLTYQAVSSDTDIVTVRVEANELILEPVAIGTATVTVMATDAGGLPSDSSQMFDVTVLGPNSPPSRPVLSNQILGRFPAIPPGQPEPGYASLDYQFNAATDPDGDPLSYGIERTDGEALPGWLNFNATTLNFTGTPPADTESVVIPVRVTVSDTGIPPASVTADFTITLADVSSSTESSFLNSITLSGEFAGNPRSGGFSQVVLNLNNAIFRQSSGALMLSDVQLVNAGPASLTLFNVIVSDPTQASLLLRYSSTAPLTEERTVGLFISRNALAADRDLQNLNAITVGANRVPTAPVLVDQSATENERFSYTFGAATDPDGDSLSYTATVNLDDDLPAWLDFDDATLTFEGFPPAGTAGELRIRVEVTDDGRPPETAPAVFTLTVAESVSVVPLVTVAAAPVPITEGGTAATLTLTVTPMSSSALTLPYTITGTGTGVTEADYMLAEGTATLPSAGMVQIPANTGSATLTLSAVDDSVTELAETLSFELMDNSGDYDLGDPSSAEIEIEQNGTPAVSVAADPTTIDEGAASTLTLTVTPADWATPLSVGYGVSGSSVSDADYGLAVAAIGGNGATVSEGALSGTVMIPAGVASGTVALTLTAVEDSMTEGVETLSVTLNPGTGYTVAGPAVALTLNDTSVAAAPTATISATSPPSLTEANLNGATLTVTLMNTEYAASLTAGQFTLSGAPSGVTIASVVRTDGANAVLTLAFNGTDFDVDATLGVTVTAAAHTGAGNLTTATVPVMAVVESNDASLRALTLSEGSLSPPFDSATRAYTATVANAVDDLTVTPTATDAGATITVGGNAVDSGAASGLIMLSVGENTITVVVTAEDGSTETYTITVTREAAAMPTAVISATSPPSLTETNLNGATLTVTLMNTEYQASLTAGQFTLSTAPSGVTVASVVRTAVNNAVLTLAFAGTDFDVDATLSVTVAAAAHTGAGNLTTATVPVMAVVESNDASLSTLVLSAGGLSPVFASATTNYTATVANAVDDLTVTPTATDAGASITVGGNAVSSGAASGLIMLSVGDTTITVVVTAEDGSTETYTITVTREAAPTAAISATSPPSLTEANLNGATLTVTLMNTEYQASLTAGQFTLSVAPSGVTVASVVRTDANNAVLTLAFNGTDFDVDATLSVTIADAAHTGAGNLTTGTVAVMAVVESNDASLSGLVLSEGGLSPVFASATTNYTATVANAVDDLTVTPTATDAGASITVGGNAVSSGAASGLIMLSVGDTSITVVVTAEDGSTETYTITVTREAAPTAAISATSPPSLTEANLNGATLTVTLMNTEYQASLTAGQFTLSGAPSGVTIASVVRTDGANAVLTLAFNGTDFDVDATLSVTVAAAAHTGAGNLTTGTVAVMAVVESNDASLSGLVLSDGNLSPVFASATTNYTATVANAVDDLTVTPTATDAGASITVGGNAVSSGAASGLIMLSVGDTSITVVVTAEDGSTETYTITVTREAAPTAAISSTSPPSLTEANLNGATLTVTLMNTEYQASLTAGQFTLSAAPSGVTVASVVRTDANNAVLTLAFNGTDFDVDATLSVTVAAAAHTGAGNLTTATVPVMAVVESNDASLSGLVLSEGGLSPVFDSATTNYTATVANAVENLTVTPTATDRTGATIIVGSNEVDSGMASGMIALGVGDTSIPVVVTAEDGSTMMTYTITVTREAVPGVSLVTIAASLAAITEGGPAATLTLTVEPTSSSVLTLPYTITGTGVTDADYTLTAGTAMLPSAGMVQIPADTGSATLTLAAVDDSVAELAETLSFELMDTGEDYDLGNPSSAEIEIMQNGTPTVSVAAAPTTIDEGAASTLTLTVTPAGWATPLSVGYGVSGSGVSDADYGLAVAAIGGNGATVNEGTLSGTVMIPAGVVSGTVALTLTAVEDSMTEGVETLSVTLNPGTGYTVAGSAVALTLNDTSVVLPITISGDTSGSVTEDEVLTATGTLTVDNPNPGGATTFVALTDEPSLLGLGSFSITTDGDWTYTLDNANSRVQRFREGAISGDNFMVTAVADPSLTQTVAIQIVGVNDAPAASIVALVDTELSVGETVTLDGAGTDVDVLDRLTFAWSANPEVGTFENASVADTTWRAPDVSGDVTLILTVTDNSGADNDADTAMVMVSVESNDASLSALALSEGDLSPLFDSATRAYTATVANAVENLMVTPTATDAGATITVDGNDVDSGAVSGAIALGVGDTPIPVVVTAEDGSTETYTITVTRAAAPTATISATSPPSLTETNLEGATLTVTLMNTEYAASLTAGQFTLSAAPSGVTIASVSRTDGANALLTLAFARTDFDVDATLGVTVTAAAHTGAGNLTTGTVAVMAVVESNDASLSGLVLSEGSLSPGFATATTTYTATVANAVDDLTVTPTATDADATITVGGIMVNSGVASAAITLGVGDTPIPVVVTAEDGSTMMTYTVTVTREAAVGVPLVTVAAAPVLITEGGPAATLTLTVTPMSSSALTLPYTITGTGTGVTEADYMLAEGTATLPSAGMVQIPANTGSATLTLSAVDDSVTELAETLSFELMDNSGDYDLGDPSSAEIEIEQNGTPTVSVAAAPTTIDEGAASTLTLTVTPADWATPLSVGYGVSGSGVSDADYGLAVAAIGGNGATVSEGTLSGTVMIPAGVASGTVALTLTAVEDSMTEGGETLSVTLNPGTGYTVAGPAVALTLNDTSVAAAPTATISATSPPSLTETNLNGATLTVTLMNTEYAASLTAGQFTLSGAPSGVTIASVVRTDGANAVLTLAFNGTDFDVDATLGVTVTAAAHTGAGNLTTGTVAVMAVVESNDASLSGLVLSEGSLSPVFASAITNYTATVANALASLTVTPTATDAGATIIVGSNEVDSGVASGSITLGVGENTITVVVTAEDGSTMMTYTVTVTRAAVSGRSLLTIAAAPVAITEGGPAATLTLTVTPMSSSALTLPYTITGTGVTEADYMLAEGTATLPSAGMVQIPANAGSATLTLTAVDDSVAELAETLSFELMDTGDDYDLGNPSSAEIEIMQNGTPTVSVAAAPTTIDEGAASTLTLTVTPADWATPLSVGYGVSGTGVSDADYGLAVAAIGGNGATVNEGTLSGTVMIPAGVASGTVALTLTAVEDSMTEGVETLSVTLNPGTGYTVAGPAVALTLNDTSVAAAPTAAISATSPTSLTETNLEGATLTVTLMNTEYAASLTAGQFTLSAAPSGVTIASVSRTDGANALLTLAFARTDFDVDATLGVTVTAAAHTGAGNLTTATVPVMAVVESNDASLRALALSEGSLSPPFDSATRAYTATVANAVDDLTVTPTATDADATITVGGIMVNSGVASAAITLGVGDTPIPVVVTAEDGSTMMTYTVTVTREAAVGVPLVTVAAAPVLITEGGPAATLTLTVTPMSSSALTLPYTITGTGTGVTEADYMLAEGTATLPSAGMVQIPANTGSATLTLSAVDDSVTELAETLSFELMDTSGDYDLGRPSSAEIEIMQNGTPTVSVAAVPTTIDEGAASTLTLTVTPADWATPLSVGYGVSGSGVSDADYGLAVAAIGGNGATVSEGTLSGTVMIPAGVASGTVALTLTAVEDSMTEGVETLSVTLNPGTGYTVAGPAVALTLNDTSVAAAPTATISATSPPSLTETNLEGATLTVTLMNTEYAASLTAGQFTLSGAPSGVTIASVVRTDGANAVLTLAFNGTDFDVDATLGVTVTAAAHTGAGNLTTGTVAVMAVVESNDASLSGLVLSDGNLSPVFASATTNYTATVANAVTSLTVTPTATDAGATITVGGTAVSSGVASAAITLGVGDTSIPVVVTAEDGSTMMTYTITVTLAAAMPTAVISATSPASLTETNLDGATLTVTLMNTEYQASLTAGQFTLSAAPSGVTIASVSPTDGNNAVLTLAFNGTDFDVDATLGVTVTAAAHTGAGNLTTATVPVMAVVEIPNRAPEAPMVSDQSATVDTDFSYSFNPVTDPDAGDLVSYSATLMDGNPLPGWLTFTPDTRTFSGIPRAGDDGTLMIRVTATDDDVSPLSSFMDFTLTVTPVGTPTLTGGPFTVDENVAGDVGSPLIPGNFPSGTQVWRIVSGNIDDVFAIDSGTGQLSLASGLDFESDPTSYTLTIELVVDGATMASVDAIITVRDVNEAPTLIRPFLDRDVAAGSGSFNFDVRGNFDDPDAGNNGVLSFMVRSSDTLIATATTGSGTVTVTPLTTGDATISIVATDGGTPGLVVDNSFILTVTPVGTPSLLDATFNANPNVPGNVGRPPMARNFPGSDTVTWEIVSGNTPDNAFTIDRATGQLSLTRGLNPDDPISPDLSVYMLTIRLTMGVETDTTTDTTVVTITVMEGRTAPAPEEQRVQGLITTLSTFGRTLSSNLIGIIEDRTTALQSKPGGGGSQVTVAGRTLSMEWLKSALSKAPGAGGGGAVGGRALTPVAGLLGLDDVNHGGTGLREVNLRQLLTDSSFQLALNGDGGRAGSWTLWGRSGISRFDGRPGSDFSVDGEVKSGQIGLDVQMNANILAGLAVSYSEGDNDYSFTGGTRSEVDIWLTSAHPYLHWSGEQGLDLWFMLGYGQGHATLEDDSGRARTDLAMGMVATGMRQELDTEGYIKWALKADGLFTHIDTDAEAGNDLGALEADTWRLRLGLESTADLLMIGDTSLKAVTELGWRLDGGDAETGMGGEISGGLNYAHPGLGLNMSARGHYLLAHRDSDFEEWGASFMATLDPGTPELGLQLSVTPSLGAASSGSGSLWEGEHLFGAAVNELTNASALDLNMEAEAAYGLAMMNDRGRLTPFSALKLSDQDARTRLGARMQVLMPRRLNIGLAVYGEQARRADTGGDLSGVLDSRIQRGFAHDMGVIELFGRFQSGAEADYQFGIDARFNF